MMSWLGSLVAPATKSASALGKEEAPSVPAVPETVIYKKKKIQFLLCLKIKVKIIMGLTFSSI